MLRWPTIPISQPTPRRTALLGAFVAAVPLAVAALSFVAARSYFPPMGIGRPDLLGIPLDFVVMVFAVAWGAIGGFVVATRRSPWVLPLALVFFTLPACLAIILGPAIILILQNATV